MRQELINKKRLLFLISFLLITSLAANAKTMRPIQILLPGNGLGQSVTWNDSLNPLPEDYWKLPSLIEGLKQQKEKISLVFGVGNDSSIFSPFSFLMQGTTDRKLAQLCQPDIQALGPEDLGLFSNKLLPKEIKNRIWTNLAPIRGSYVFPPQQKIKKSGVNLRLLSFISKEYLKNYPLNTWGDFEVYTPVKALRRLSPNFKNQEINIVVSHLTNDETIELIDYLKNRQGYFIITRIKQPGEPAIEIPSIEKIKNCFLMELKPGQTFLPLIKIFRKNFGSPRIILRSLPLAKAPTGNSLKLFEKESKSIFLKLNRVIKVITTQIMPTTAPYRFKPQLHADFVRKFSRSNIAIIQDPVENFRSDNLLKPGNILTSFNNFFILKYRVTGKQLIHLISELIYKSGNKPLFFSGVQFSVLGNQIRKFKLYGQPLNLESHYSLSVSSSILSDKEFKPLFQDLSQSRNEGLTQWDILLTQLESTKISSEMLDN